jgi:ATP-dependent Lhr-like helicase
VQAWFRRQLGEPTEIQRLAWPHISDGEHVLVSAPTGSGKTLAAFLWAIDRLATGGWESGALRVLYVSPLRALGNDIRRNLDRPLAELVDEARGTGADPPVIRTATRTGDTPQDERRRMLRHPPEILITTPETINILLTSRSGRHILGDLRCVIVDEVHAVAGSKRGVHMITALERLAMLAGEFQRIALSATVRPLDDVARWVGGSRLEGDGADPSYRPRRVVVVEGAMPKRYDLEVVMPVDDEAGRRDPEALWKQLTVDLGRRIRRNTSTLTFGNSRRTVEKLARLLNEASRDQTVYSHHGALSREIRSVVEERMKAGAVKAIVATSSLELGIDVGAIDEVALVQCPPSVASTVQRLGRAGHHVGGTSRGVLYPLHPRGLLTAAALTPLVERGEVEDIRPVRNPLDVLAQVVLSMVVAEPQDPDRLFAIIRTATPYRALPRHHFDLVLDMLAGRYASARLRPLRPLVTIDPVDGVVRPRPGTERLLYLAGGTIPDRGYYQLRVEGSGAAVGELDEEFVWERSVGDTFSLGVQSWRIQRITHNDVFVTPVTGGASMAPFWRAEDLDRSHALSTRIAELLERWTETTDRDTLLDDLVHVHRLSATAARELQRYLDEQESATGVLPHRHRVVVELTAPPGLPGGQVQLVLHTLWGGRVNRPFAAALATAWHEQTGRVPQIVHDDDCVAVTCPPHEVPDDPFALVPPERLDTLLRERLETSGFFGARFREAAGCALVLPRAGVGRRTPLWLNRQRAKELLTEVTRWDDFPLVLETWRSCVQDEFELTDLERLLHEVRQRDVEVVHVRTDRPSPFTQQVTWRQTNNLMYADDSADGRRSGALRPELLREVVFDGRLRPRLGVALTERLRAKLHRTAPGYAPSPGPDLADWVDERVVVPLDEWRQLVDAVCRDHDVDVTEVDEATAPRVLVVHPPHGDIPLVVSVSRVRRLEIALGTDLEGLEPRSIRPDNTTMPDPVVIAARPPLDIGPDEALAEVVSEWLRCEPPVRLDRLRSIFGVAATRLDPVLEDLAAERTIVIDQLTDGSVIDEVCDAENLERLLRLARAESRPDLQPLAAEALPLFLATLHGMGTVDAEPRDLQAAFERLFGLPATVARWEADLLPARVDPFASIWLDGLLGDTDLRWVGCGKGRVLFSLDGDRDLFQCDIVEPVDTPDARVLFPQRFGRFPLEDLVRASGLSTTEVTDRLWRLAWAGRVTTDGFAPVRQGAATGFQTPDGADGTAGRASRTRRPRFERWRADRPFGGSWFLLEAPDPPADLLEEEELRRDRVRVLLDRYGILFREILGHELPSLRWGEMFRSLRLMELAGEVVSGRFVNGPPGLQFASHDAVRRLREDLPSDRIWWVSAVDPCSPCGLGLAAWGDRLPRRVPGNHLVFHGDRMVMVSERRGARLQFDVAPDHPHVRDYLRVLEVLLTRPVDPVRSLVVETVNAEPATAGPWRDAFESRFHVTRTPTGLRLDRRY